jgi:hypothetical protein
VLFRAIELFLFAAGAVSTAPLNRSQSTIPSANAVAARTTTAFEQSADQDNSGQKQSHTYRKRTKHAAQAQTLTGIVEWEYKPLAWDCDVPNCDHFALYDDATHTNYEIDDARAALPYEGKRARVTGVVDTKNSIIHLISIEAAK